MRLVYIAPHHGKSGYSGYSSEPFLAEAGAHALSAWCTNYGRVSIETLAYPTDAVFPAEANAGELVGKLILMLTYDYAVETSIKPVANPPPHPPNFSTGMSVEAFLRSLIPNEHVEHFLGSKPINLPSSSGSAEDLLLQELNTPLSKAFSNASVRFTHFIRTTDDVHVNLAWAALCRGAAIICHNTQETVDLVIPVVLNRDNRMAKENITAIFVKCKLRPSHTSGTDANSIQFFESGRLLYIAVTMDLRVDQDEIECPAQPVWSWKEVPNALGDVHPQYAIAIRGCSNRTYTVINPGEEGLYKKLLGKHGL